MKYFSLFTGIGGLDAGLEARGAECVGFSEIRESSISIYSRHFPDHVPFGDVTKIDFASLPDFDVLTGGFPCQSFSMAGARKGFDDKRGHMIFRIHALLEAKKPRFAVLENVKGILTHDEGRTYRNVFALLGTAGYFVRCVLLNARHYGQAQSRERVLFLCAREDFPAKNPVVVDGSKRFRDFRDKYGPYRWLTPKAVERLLSTGKWCSPLGGYDVARTFTTSESSCGNDRMMVQEDDGRWRYLSVLEGERLQGFPDKWTEGEGLADRWFALGNAVNAKVSQYLFTDYLNGIWF